MIADAEQTVWHNGIAYDVPVLKKLRPRFRISQRGVLDTLLLARLIWPREALRDKDFARWKAGKMPGNLIGAHGLEAFGYRLGLMKGDYSDWCKAQGLDPWSQWRPEMQSYCEQDVAVTEALYERCVEKNYSPDAIEVEHQVQWIIKEMERNGFPFDEQEAAKLYSKIVAERDQIEHSLKQVFPPRYIADAKVELVKDEETGKKRKVRHPAVVTPTKTIRYKNRPHVIAGAPYTKVTQVEFNPASRDHIADRLMRLGWKPQDFTDNGQPIVDETTLAALPYPEAKVLTRYLLLQKRAGQLSEGDEGWLKVSRDGCVYHSVNTLGAVTRRASHSKPNIAQVPKVGSYFGAECRALFHAGVDAHGVLFDLVGCDLSGIELRMLAHYMARYDGGAYAEAVINGSSEAGTDVHSLNCRAIGLDPKQVYVINGKSAKGRDIAKTFIYAFLYGAGAAKLASILGQPESEGAKLKARFLKGLPALKKLIDAVQEAAKRGYLIGLDGGRIPVRSAHAALNTLLQSAGAIVAKVWIVEAYRAFGEQGWLSGPDFRIRAWVHDELQISARKEIADALGKTCVAAIEAAGKRLNLRVPITGEYKRGANWRDCH